MSVKRYRDHQGRFCSKERYEEINGQYLMGHPTGRYVRGATGAVYNCYTNDYFFFGKGIARRIPALQVVEMGRQFSAEDRMKNVDANLAAVQVFAATDDLLGHNNPPIDDPVVGAAPDMIAIDDIVDGPREPAIGPDIKPLGSMKFGLKPKKAFRPVLRSSMYPSCCGATIITNFYTQDKNHDMKLDVQKRVEYEQGKGILIATVNKVQKDWGWGKALEDNDFVLVAESGNPVHGNRSTIYQYTRLGINGERQKLYTNKESNPI